MKRIVLILIILSFCINPLFSRYDPAIHDYCSKDQLKGFVKEAVAFAKIYGKRLALKEFKNKEGLFNRGELYIYAYNMKGRVLSHGANASLIGKNLIKLKDPTGKLIIKEMTEQVQKKGSGWLNFHWFHPENNKIAPKIGYFEKVDNNWWLGSGIYTEFD
ncbi:MAG: calcium:proton antiporter [bacterium]|nr:calcium:proton antiporter [bacterium]